MSIRNEITVIKVPRDCPLKDIPPNFPKFQNDLHLDLLENKKKLKRGLPPIRSLRKKISEYKREQFILKTPQKSSEIELKGNSANPIFRECPPVPEETPSTPDNSPEPSIGDDQEILDTIVDTHNDAKIYSSPSENEYPEHSETSSIHEERCTSRKRDDDESVSLKDRYEAPSEKSFEEQTDEEREMEEKKLILWKWRIIEKQYPSIEKRNYTMYSDYRIMKIDYDQTIQQISMENSVDTYKKYLMLSWFGLEYITTNMIGIDMSGFAQNQMSCAEQYNTLLIELGERKYMKWGSDWPVETRLIAMVIFQGIIFYVGKKMGQNFSKGGGGVNIMSFLSSFMGSGMGPDTPAKTPQPAQTKRRGPSVRLSDLRA